MAEQIRLNTVDCVEILTLIDNVLDLLLMNTDVAKRIGPGGSEVLQMPVVEAPLFESIIPPTVEALREVGPEVIAPSHCTGWRAVHALADAFPFGFIPGSVGTRYVLASGEA